MSEFGNDSTPAHSAQDAEKKTILRARAAALAREPQAEKSLQGVFEIVEFQLASERYAIESRWVREVYPLKDLTPLPCTPAFVLGIVNVRGQILPVLDIRQLFDLPIRGLTDLNKVIILQKDDIQAGILADAIVATHTVAADQLQSALPTMTGIRSDDLRGVTSDGLAVLDAAKILSDDRIIVNEEV